MKRIMKIFIIALQKTAASLLILACLMFSLGAQGFGDKTADTPTIRPFSEGDEKYLQQGRDRINQLTRRHFGSSLQQQRAHDIALLQRLLDSKRVVAKDRRLLQDMGIVLGDLLLQQFNLRWVIYADKYGPSRALQLKHSENFLFPITMISRRAEVGVTVDISELYDQASIKIEGYKAAARRFY
tara:strand:+ start:831 stop:1382 length:552 start_codon:yes stop_codon:yes gene_type:complete